MTKDLPRRGTKTAQRGFFRMREGSEIKIKDGLDSDPSEEPGETSCEVEGYRASAPVGAQLDTCTPTFAIQDIAVFDRSQRGERVHELRNVQLTTQHLPDEDAWNEALAEIEALRAERNATPICPWRQDVLAILRPIRISDMPIPNHRIKLRITEQNNRYQYDETITDGLRRYGQRLGLERNR